MESWSAWVWCCVVKIERSDCSRDLSIHYVKFSSERNCQVPICELVAVLLRWLNKQTLVGVLVGLVGKGICRFVGFDEHEHALFITFLLTSLHCRIKWKCLCTHYHYSGGREPIIKAAEARYVIWPKMGLKRRQHVVSKEKLKVGSA